MTAEPLDNAIERAIANAPFLRGLIRREPGLIETMRSQGFDAAIRASLARLDPDIAAVSVRQARAGVALTVALADLSGAWPLETVTRHLTRFADTAVQFAITAAFAERDASPAGLAVLALGKMGSFELNYSSDIDLIFLHEADLIPRRPGEDPTEAAARIARRVAALLSERTADGYALRVDLRLRPDPENTPPSLPVGAAEHYYQSEALAWERAAFIRARAAAGDLTMGNAFLQAISPFVWRRTLDYSALAEIREVSLRIRDHFAEGQKLGPGFDLKRGRGGIREVEFHAQTLQMIWGGRDPSLRSGNTIEALSALTAAGRMPADDAALLADAYRHFRTLEHRFQMVNDQQTHSVPRLAAERAAVARLDGYTSWKEVESELAPRLKQVSRLYDQLIDTGREVRGSRIPLAAAEAERWATQSRIDDPALLVRLLEDWRSARARSLRVPEAIQAFEQVIPALARTVGHGKGGREALLRLDQFINALPAGVQFWRLLVAHANLAGVVGRLLTATPLLADALAKKPALIDVLLEPALPLADAASATAELRQLVRGMPEEMLLDRVRIWTAERRFQLGVQLLDAAICPMQAAREMALMAEAAVAVLLQAILTGFIDHYGDMPGQQLVPLALGRFGGGALTTQSDLDLVLLFSGSFETRSTGTPPITASQWFNRLGQRLIAALSVPTAAGPLYEVDTRLRPSGNDGLLVVSIDSFARYQQNDADVWETMALTRARPVGAEPDAAAAAQAVIDSVLTTPRDPAHIRREALAMRRHIAKHKRPRGPFDVKLMKGGLVDIEFIIQTRALALGHAVPPELVAAARQLAPELVEPARLMMSVLVMLRLVQPHDAEAAPGAAAGLAIARACGRPGIAALKADLASARAIVQNCWAETFEGA